MEMQDYGLMQYDLISCCIYNYILYIPLFLVNKLNANEQSELTQWPVLNMWLDKNTWAKNIYL